MSCVICHMLHGMCHKSNIMFSYLLSCAASWWRVSYQQGLPRLLCICKVRLQQKKAYLSSFSTLWIKTVVKLKDGFSMRSNFKVRFGKGVQLAQWALVTKGFPCLVLTIIHSSGSLDCSRHMCFLPLPAIEYTRVKIILLVKHSIMIGPGHLEPQIGP